MNAPQNPQAFPLATDSHVYSEGMTLLDWFAGQLLGAMPNFDVASTSDEDLQLLAHQLYRISSAMLVARHREAAEAASKAREAALVEALKAILPFAEDMTESGRQAIANAHRVLAALTKEPGA